MTARPRTARARSARPPRALLAVLVAVLGTLATGPPAAGLPAAGPSSTAVDGRSSSDDALLLGPDGTTWAPELDRSLFGHDALVVPGTTVARDLWVRNAGPTPARVLVDVASDVVPGGPRAGLGAWLTVRLDGEPPDGATWRGPELRPGEAARVQVSVAMSPDAPSSTRRSVAGVLEAVHLVESGGSASPGLLPPPAGPGTLPETGADAARAALVAVLAIVVGAVGAVLGRKVRPVRAGRAAPAGGSRRRRPRS